MTDAASTKPKMTAQQKKDLAPILREFPRTTLDSDGAPEIRGQFHDFEGDPISFVVDMDGHMTIDTASTSYFIVSVDLLSTLSRECQTGKRLFKEWEKTESGKAWTGEIGL